MSIIPASTYESIAYHRAKQPGEDIARFTGEHTRNIAEGLGGIGGVRVIVARDGRVCEDGSVVPPFALLSIPDPWIAVVLSKMMHQEQVFTLMACWWALYPLGEPGEHTFKLVGSEREHLLEPHEHLWHLEPIYEGNGGTATQWLEDAHEDCGRFEVKAVEMNEAAEGFLAELHESGAPLAAEGPRKAPAAKPRWERPLLPSGATLAALVSLGDKDMLSDQARRSLLGAERLGSRSLMPFTTIEPLTLASMGSRRPALRPCRCHVPALQTEADSVNHAYTLITEAFQPTRHSKVGNVFREVAVKHLVDAAHDGLGMGLIPTLRAVAQSAGCPALCSQHVRSTSGGLHMVLPDRTQVSIPASNHVVINGPDIPWVSAVERVI